ncbi:MAG: hypothetical protein K5987_05430, partial [Lachnospiraceae bacterium]|nr:hypothetical protein [Lachnospiraceae bacterium]
MKMDLTSVSNFIEKLEKLSFVRKLYRPSGFRMAEGTKIIAIFCHTLKEGGSQRAVESLIEKIEKLGFSICVFSPEDGKYASIYTDKYKTYTIVSDMGISLHGYERDMLQGFAAVFINSICSS